jgi:hypothetical protein
MRQPEVVTRRNFAAVPTMPIFWWLANSWQHKIVYRVFKSAKVGQFSHLLTLSVCGIIATNHFSLAMSTSFNNPESCDYTNINLVNSFVLNRTGWPITFEVGQPQAPSPLCLRQEIPVLGKNYLIANYDGQFSFRQDVDTVQPIC